MAVAVERRRSLKAFARAVKNAAASGFGPHSLRGPGALETARLELAMVIIFLAIRSVHVGQGLLDAGLGLHSYVHPAWAAALAALCVVESSWLAQRLLRRQRLDPIAVRVDVAFGVVGLFVIGAALTDNDRTASLNWMLGFTVGTTVAVGLGLRAREGALAVLALASAYAASVWPNIDAGGSSATTALSNVMSYFGFYVVAAAAIWVVRRMGRELQAARDDAVEQSRLLATEQERTRQHRLLHDSALQTLEAIAKGWGTGDEALVARARVEATRLRHALSGAPETEARSNLASALATAAAELEPLGLRTELVTAELDHKVTPEVVAAVCDATREALTNVVKHGQVLRAVVRAVVANGALQVTVRDSGTGFSPREGAGFGITNSIHGRMAEVGGKAIVNSSPGSGTKVTLRVPL